MIATNQTNDTKPLPAVLFPVAWPAGDWLQVRPLLDRIQASVSYHWRHIAPLVELARIRGGTGVLRVTLEPGSAVSLTMADGCTFMVANARAVWMDEPPSPGACSVLGEQATKDIETPPTRRGVTVVAAVLVEDEPPTACTLVGRIRAGEPHAEWLAEKLEHSPNCTGKPVWMVSVSTDGIAGMWKGLAT